MTGFSNRKLGGSQWEVHLIDYVVPAWALTVTNPGAPARGFKVGSGTSADGPFADVTAFTNLAGTVTLTNASDIVAGAATAFDTALSVGDVVALADRKVLAQVKSIESATSMTLEAVWAGATTAGATLKDVTMVERTLPNGVGTFEDLQLPLDESSDPIVSHKFLYVEAVSLPVTYALDSGCRTFPVRDSLTEQTI